MSSSSATNLDSVRKAKNRLINFLKTEKEVPAQILEREAPRIEAEARLLTPLKKGKLENSVRCKVSKSQTRPGLTIRASARNRGYNYAGIQHENTSYSHPIKGQAHYLKIPFDKGVQRIKYAMRKEVRLK